MAYRFDGTDDDVRFSMGALDTYTMGACTFAALVKHSTTGDWGGVITISDGGGTTVLIDAIEWDNTNHFAFWNGRTSSNDISGSTTATHTDTANWWVVALTWGGASSAPRFHWKQLGSGSWTHESLADATGGDSLTVATADRTIVGTDPGGGDDFTGDIVWAGIKKSNVVDAVTSLDTTNWSDVISFGWDWLVGFEASGTLADYTGGGGNEVSRSGTTLVSDPAGWSWTVGGAAQLVMAESFQAIPFM